MYNFPFLISLFILSLTKVHTPHTCLMSVVFSGLWSRVANYHKIIDKKLLLVYKRDLIIISKLKGQQSRLAVREAPMGILRKHYNWPKSYFAPPPPSHSSNDAHSTGKPLKPNEGCIGLCDETWCCWRRKIPNPIKSEQRC